MSYGAFETQCVWPAFMDNTTECMYFTHLDILSPDTGHLAVSLAPNLTYSCMVILNIILVN